MNRKLRIAALVMTLVLVLCACGSSNNSANTKFNRSSGLDENGYWKGIKASEYVELCDTSSITITAAAIEEQKQAFLKNYPDYKTVKDRVVKDGDTVNIDYVGKIDGVAFDGGSTGGNGTSVTIGVTSYIDNFLEQLIGHMPGETFDINVTFPDPYPNNKDLAGKPAVFTTTVNFISEAVTGTWGDDFVKKQLADNYGWETAKEAEDGIKSALAEEYIYKNSKFLKDTPASMIEYQNQVAIEYYKEFAAAYNIEFESFIQLYLGYPSSEDFLKDYAAEAKETSQYYLIYQAMAEKAGYTVSMDEIKAYFLETNGSEDYKEFEDYSGLPYIKAMIMYEKMGDQISSAIKVQ